MTKEMHSVETEDVNTIVRDGECGIQVILQLLYLLIISLYSDTPAISPFLNA